MSLQVSGGKSEDKAHIYAELQQLHKGVFLGIQLFILVSACK